MESMIGDKCQRKLLGLVRRIPMASSLPWPKLVVKMADYDYASTPMLRELAEEFERLLISTGATYDQEIEKTTEMLSKMNFEFISLHCIISYANNHKRATSLKWSGSSNSLLGLAGPITR